MSWLWARGRVPQSPHKFFYFFLEMCGNLLLCIVYITITITKYYYNYKYNYHLNCNLSQSPLINYPRFYLRLSICFFRPDKANFDHFWLYLYWWHVSLECGIKRAISINMTKNGQNLLYLGEKNRSTNGGKILGNLLKVTVIDCNLNVSLRLMPLRIYILLFIKKINKCHVKVRVRTLTDMVA